MEEIVGVPDAIYYSYDLPCVPVKFEKKMENYIVQSKAEVFAFFSPRQLILVDLATSDNTTLINIALEERVTFSPKISMIKESVSTIFPVIVAVRNTVHYFQSM